MRYSMTALLLSALVVAGCGDASGADQEPAAPVTVTETATVSASPEPTQSAPEEPETSAASEDPDTPQIGDVVTATPDWQVKVVDINFDADAEIAEINMLGDRADPDGRFVLVTYEATYTGNEERATLFLSLDAEWITADQRILSEYDADAITPADFESWPEYVRPGGTLKAQAVFDVDPDQVSGSLLSFVDDDDSTIRVDFAIE